jgi:hypothetical protein
LKEIKSKKTTRTKDEAEKKLKRKQILKEKRN